MTIDVHGHLSPPESVRRFPMPRRLGDVAGMIEAKLRLGITVTVVGSPVGAGAMVPLPGVDNYAQGEDELRRFHDWLAALIGSCPEHLRGYVYVNPFGGSAHLANAADRVRQSGFVGFIANTSVGGRYLTDSGADEFFGMVAAAGVPLFLHAPAVPAAGYGLRALPLIEQLGRFCDVTIGVACCVLGGWLAKYPTLRLLASTGGGALGLLAEKLDLTWAPAHWDGDAGPAGCGGVGLPWLPRRPSTYLNRVWVDTATPSGAAISLGLRVFGPGRVVFGTDSPPLPPRSVARLLTVVSGLEVDEATRRSVLVGNACQLFGDRLLTSDVSGE